MHQAAEDDAERARNRARLYAPPREAQHRRRAPQSPGRRPGMTLEQIRAMTAQMAVEDSRLAGARQASR